MKLCHRHTYYFYWEQFVIKKIFFIFSLSKKDKLYMCTHLNCRFFIFYNFKVNHGWVFFTFFLIIMNFLFSLSFFLIQLSPSYKVTPTKGHLWVSGQIIDTLKYWNTTKLNPSRESTAPIRPLLHCWREWGGGGLIRRGWLL